MSEELMISFEKRFTQMKKELGFKVTLNDLDEIFFLRDVIAREGHVPFSLSRMLCHRMSDTLMNWAGYLQSLLVPNTGSILNCTESQMFDEKEKEEMMKLIDTILSFVSSNAVIGLSKNKREEAEFIDGSVKLWRKTLQPELLRLTKKIHTSWVERAHAH